MFQCTYAVWTNLRDCSKVLSMIFNEIRLQRFSLDEAQIEPWVKNEPKQMRTETKVK